MLIQNISSNPVSVYPSDRPVSDGASASGVVVQAPVDSKPNVAVSTPAAPTQPADQKPTASHLKSMVDGINQALQQSSNKNLEFSIDAESNKTVVKLVDNQTGDIIRQYPSEATLAISKAITQMQEQLQQATLAKTQPPSSPGLLVKQRA